MITATTGTLAAGLLALGFALVGEALLGRASRTLFAWNESFLIGIGVCAAVLFPLTLLAPRHALDAEFGGMALGALVAAVLRFSRRPASPPEPAAGDLAALRRDRLALLLLASAVLSVLYFALLNLRYGHTWDSVQVWGTRAKLLFVEGGLSRRWFPEDPYDSRLLAYPPLISLYEALLSRVRGEFAFDRIKPIFPFFYASMLLSTFRAARSLCSLRWSLAMVLLVALLPELNMGGAAGGYVDMPLAAFVAAVVAACLGSGEARTGWRSPLPWLIGAMTAVKQEGMVLALVACGTILCAWIAERPRRLAARLRSAWSGGVVVLAFVAARVGYVSWIGVHDTTWGPFDAEHRARAAKSVGLVASLCLRYALEPRTWGLFWPAFFLAAALAAAYRLARPGWVALATIAAMGVEASVFLFTNWDIAVHIEGAYSRLLAQLAPAAAVVIGAAAERVWRSPPA